MSWRRMLVTFALVIPLIALLGFGMTRDPRELPSTLPGRPAPEFALSVLDPPGAPPASLAAHQGEVVVLNFWASWCLACRDEHRALSNVAEQYQGQGVQFYGMVYNDKPENARAWISEMGGQSYPSLLDPDGATSIDYGLYGVPETFIIGPDGRVAYKHIGPVTEPMLTRWIEQARAGQEVAS